MEFSRPACDKSRPVYFLDSRNDATMTTETTTDAGLPLAAPHQIAMTDASKDGVTAATGAEKFRDVSASVFAAARACLAWAVALPKSRSKSRTMTTLGWLAVIALAGYIAFTAIIFFAQRSLMYFPDPLHTTPAAAGLPEAEEVTLTAADGVKSLVWQVAPRDDKPVILYFHGNGGALRYRVERFHHLITDGVGLLALEYRGYGGLSGSPSETGLNADAEAAYAYAVAHYPVQQIVVWGESLGTGVAVALAAEKPVGRVILEAPFTSAVAVGARHYWYLPVRFLMKDQFHSDRRIGKVTAPLLILHGVHDQTVPYAMGQHLFELANKPKHIVRFLDGGSGDLDANGALDAVGRFLAGDLD
jgi:pimeloyl-ACP methyl ester carboxylesterase